jgi:bla regulator protein BlaR1
MFNLRSLAAAALAAAVLVPAFAHDHHTIRFSRDESKTTDDFVLAIGDSKTINVSNMDLDDVEAMHDRIGGDYLWFRHGGKSYVIRDRAIIRAAIDAWEPQTEIGRQQAALGAKQAALGTQQARLGNAQARLGERQAKLSRRQSRGGADDQMLEAEQRKLDREQDDLSRQQDELGRKQDVLGAEQDKLGEQQDRLSQEAEKKMQRLIDEALRRGVAVRQ